jgi:hypothetical protein
VPPSSTLCSLSLAISATAGSTPTVVRPALRLHKLRGENVWSISFAGQYRAVFRLGQRKRLGNAHIVWEFIGTHDEYIREY